MARVVKVRREGDDVVAPLRRGGLTYLVRVDPRRVVSCERDGVAVDLAADRLLAALGGAPPPYLADVDAVQAALDALADVDVEDVLTTLLMGRANRQSLVAGYQGGLSPVQQAVVEVAYPHEMVSAPGATTSTLLGLARRGDRDVALALLRRDDLTVQVAREVYDACPQHRDYLTAGVHFRLEGGSAGDGRQAHAGSTVQAEAALRAWAGWVATSDRTDDRMRAASWRGQDSGVLRDLAADPEQQVRLAVVAQPHLTADVVEVLTADPDPLVRRAVVLRGHPDVRAARAIAADLDDNDLVAHWRRARRARRR